MQLEQDKLKVENTNLVAAFREKSRRNQQTQELYDRLKRKEMTAATQSAAFDSVDEVLGSMANQSSHAQNQPNMSQHYQPAARAQPQQDFSHLPTNFGGPQQMTHGTSYSNGSQGSGGLMPPPPNRATGFGSRAFESGKPTSNYYYFSNQLSRS